MKQIEQMNVNEVHLFLCHKIDKQKLKAKIMKGANNSIEL